MTDNALAALVDAAQVCDGLAKGLTHPDWPRDPWQALRRLVLMMLEPLAAAPKGAVVRLALHA